MKAFPFKDLFTLLLESADNPLILADGEGKVFDLNKKCAQLFIRPKNELLGQDLKSLASGELDSIHSGEAKQIEIKLCGLDGELKTYGARLWRTEIDDAPGPFALIEICEVSAQEKLERKLAAERDKFHTIINSMGDALGIVDQNFKIRFMNKALMEMAGKNALGKECYKVYTGSNAPCFNCPLKMGIGKLDVDTVEVTGSNDRTFLITHSPIKDDDGNTAVLEILKDVSEGKKLEKKLFDSERRAMLSQFSSALAHDLRNPIVGINKTLQMLTSNYEQFGKEFQIKKLADLSSSSALLLGLVNDMLDIFQDSHSSLVIRKSHFSFDEAVHEVLPLLKADVEEKDIILSFNSCPDEPLVFGDKRRLQRVIINLLDNAIKFSPPKKHIVLASRLTSPRGSSRNNLLFSVEDEGPGIHAADLNKIFELFYKKENDFQSKSSTGIGLYFCKVIVEAHGGKIWAEDKRGGGSILQVSLPL